MCCARSASGCARCASAAPARAGIAAGSAATHVAAAAAAAACAGGAAAGTHAATAHSACAAAARAARSGATCAGAAGARARAGSAGLPGASATRRTARGSSSSSSSTTTSALSERCTHSSRKRCRRYDHHPLLHQAPLYWKAAWRRDLEPVEPVRLAGPKSSQGVCRELPIGHHQELRERRLRSSTPLLSRSPERCR
jgi:hypothetical protein